MLSIQYAYIVLGLLLLVVWLLLFLTRKDTRREMIIISIAFGIAGLLAEFAYLKDWWQPLTITGTPLGIEDFLFGFTIGGIASVIYEVIFKKRLSKEKSFRLITREHLIDTSIILLLPIIFFGGTIFLGLNTFQASIIGYGLPILIMYFKRKDLIVDSLISGISLLLIIFIIYAVLNLITPGWIMHFWTFKNVPPIVFLNVPIDDLVWYLFTGAFIGIMYEFLHDSPLFRLRRN